MIEFSNQLDLSFNLPDAHYINIYEDSSGIDNSKENSSETLLDSDSEFDLDYTKPLSTLNTLSRLDALEGEIATLIAEFKQLNNSSITCSNCSKCNQNSHNFDCTKYNIDSTLKHSTSLSILAHFPPPPPTPTSSNSSPIQSTNTSNFNNNSPNRKKKNVLPAKLKKNSNLIDKKPNVSKRQLSIDGNPHASKYSNSSGKSSPILKQLSPINVTPSNHNSNPSSSSTCSVYYSIGSKTSSVLSASNNSSSSIRTNALTNNKNGFKNNQENHSSSVSYNSNRRVNDKNNQENYSPNRIIPINDRNIKSLPINSSLSMSKQSSLGTSSLTSQNAEFSPVSLQFSKPSLTKTPFLSSSAPTTPTIEQSTPINEYFSTSSLNNSADNINDSINSRVLNENTKLNSNLYNSKMKLNNMDKLKDKERNNKKDKKKKLLTLDTSRPQPMDSQDINISNATPPSSSILNSNSNSNSFSNYSGDSFSQAYPPPPLLTSSSTVSSLSTLSPSSPLSSPFSSPKYIKNVNNNSLYQSMQIPSIPTPLGSSSPIRLSPTHSAGNEYDGYNNIGKKNSKNETNKSSRLINSKQIYKSKSDFSIRSRLSNFSSSNSEHKFDNPSPSFIHFRHNNSTSSSPLSAISFPQENKIHILNKEHAKKLDANNKKIWIYELGAKVKDIFTNNSHSNSYASRHSKDNIFKGH